MKWRMGEQVDAKQQIVTGRLFRGWEFFARFRGRRWLSFRSDGESKAVKSWEEFF